MAETKDNLVDKLNESASRMRKIRRKAKRLKAQLSGLEPDAVDTLGSSMQSSNLGQSQGQGDN